MPPVLTRTGEPNTAAPWSGVFPRLPGGRWAPLLLVLGLAGGAVLVRYCLQHHVPLPFCLLRSTTGVPCPACGSTRSLAAWAHLDPMEAFRFNPLFCLLTLTAAVWAVAGLADALRGTRWQERLANAVWSRTTTARVLVVAAINWVYLCLTLPR
jgi:hypothetical protein